MSKFDFGKIKLIACDMDGTFLGSDHRIPLLNKNVLKICEENGVNFAVCTGRAIAALGLYMDVLDTSGILITYNGAKILDKKSNKIILRQSLFKDDVDKIYELSLKFDATLIVWADEKLYVNKNNDHAKFYAELSGVDYTYFDGNMDFVKVLPNGRTNVDKMFWEDTPERTTWLYENAKEFVPRTVGFFSSGSCYLEFVSIEANKGNGIKFLCDYLGITKDQVVSFGDAENDLPMYDAAGIKVAMGNAIQSMKDKADYVVETNDEAGVYKGICKLFKVGE